MDLFSNEVKQLLNNLDDYIPQVLNDTAVRFVKSNILADVNGVLLYANEYALLNRIAQLFVKNLFDIENLHVRQSSVEENDFTYLLSDYHMEFELNEKSLAYIKSIISNKTISKRSFVFIIKNAESKISRHHYLALRSLIDMNSTSKFIITTGSISFLESSLTSRLINVNCSFPFNKVKSIDIIPNDIDPKELYERFHRAEGNIISLLQRINSNLEDALMWQKAVDKVLDSFATEKKQFVIISSVRELVYKLYHIGVSLKEICMYIISKYTHHKNVHDIVEFISTCEHTSLNGAKEILIYERLLIGLYKIL